MCTRSAGAECLQHRIRPWQGVQPKRALLTTGYGVPAQPPAKVGCESDLSRSLARRSAANTRHLPILCTRVHTSSRESHGLPKSRSCRLWIFRLWFHYHLCRQLNCSNPPEAAAATAAATAQDFGFEPDPQIRFPGSVALRAQEPSSPSGGCHNEGVWGLEVGEKASLGILSRTARASKTCPKTHMKKTWS